MPQHPAFGLLFDRRPSADRNPLIIRANWEAVAVNASSASRCSSTTSTTRVSSRTFEYDNRASRNNPAMVGIRLSALATRTCSRATPGVIEQHHDSQCANDLNPVQNRIALVASNSPNNSTKV
jgi:hypothetical protein